MKPLFLLCLPFPPPYSGEETLSLSLRQAFKEMGSRAYSIAYFDTSNKQSNRMRGKGSLGNLYAVGRLTGKFLITLLRKKPYAIYVPIAQNRLGFAKYSVLIQMASFFCCKLISSLSGDHFNLFFERSNLLYQWWIRRILSKIDILVVQGEALKKQFEGLMGPKKIRVVPLGIEPSLFLKDGREQKQRENIHVLFVGHLSKAKGVFELLEAIPLVVQKCPLIHFHLVGEVLERERNILHISNPRDNREKFFELLNNPKVKPYVTVHGTLYGEEKIRRYHQSDIFVLPSYSESFPFVLLEAAASGLAVVTTPVGANPEIYKPGENVLFVQVGNPNDLAEKIIKLAQDHPLRRKMGENNMNLVKENHTHIHFGERMHLVFLELLSLNCPLGREKNPVQNI